MRENLMKEVAMLHFIDKLFFLKWIYLSRKYFASELVSLVFVWIEGHVRFLL